MADWVKVQPKSKWVKVDEPVPRKAERLLSVGQAQSIGVPRGSVRQFLDYLKSAYSNIGQGLKKTALSTDPRERFIEGPKQFLSGALTSANAPFVPAENIVRSFASREPDIDKILNFIDRPTTGGEGSDFLADIASGVLPVGGLAKAGVRGLARKLATTPAPRIRGLLPEPEVKIPLAVQPQRGGVTEAGNTFTPIDQRQLTTGVPDFLATPEETVAKAFDIRDPVVSTFKGTTKKRPITHETLEQRPGEIVDYRGTDIDPVDVAPLRLEDRFKHAFSGESVPPRLEETQGAVLLRGEAQIRPEIDTLQRLMKSPEFKKLSPNIQTEFKSRLTEMENLYGPKRITQADIGAAKLNAPTKAPGRITTMLAKIRPVDNYIERYNPEITTEIRGTARRGAKFEEYWKTSLNTAIKGLKSAELNELGKMLKGDLTSPGWSNQRLINAHGQVRQMYDQMFAVPNDPSLAQYIGKIGDYQTNYLPWIKQNIAGVAPDTFSQERIFRDLFPSEFKSTHLKQRPQKQSDEPAIEDVVELTHRYIRGLRKTIFDIPAYKRVQAQLERIPDGDYKKLVRWYNDFYMGQPSARTFDSQTLSGQTALFLRDRIYKALIGLKPTTAVRNLSTLLTNTLPELGLERTAKGVGKALTKKGRQTVQETGQFLEQPGLEGEFLRGPRQKLSEIENRVVMGPFNTVERADRYISDLGARSGSTSTGPGPSNVRLTDDPSKLEFYDLTPAESFGQDIVGKTQFIYGKESPIPAFANRPLSGTLTSFAFRQGDRTATFAYDAIRHPSVENTRKAVLHFTTLAGLYLAGERVLDGYIPNPSVFIDLYSRSSRYLRQLSLGQKVPTDIPQDLVKSIFKYLIPSSLGDK